MYVTIAYYEGFRNQYTAAEQHRENKPSAQINTNKYMGRTELSFCHFHRFSDQNHRETTKKSTSFFLKTS